MLNLKRGDRVKVVKALPIPRWFWQVKRYVSPDWYFDVEKIVIHVRCRGEVYEIEPQDIDWEEIERCR